MSILANLSLIGLMLTNNISLNVNKADSPTNYDPLNLVEKNIRTASSSKEEFTYDKEIGGSIDDGKYTTNSATVTVLTHGMAGSFSDWFTITEDENKVDIYDTDSSYILPFKINQLINFQEFKEGTIYKTNIFRFKYVNNSTVLDRLVKENNNYHFNINETITENDAQSHLILIYDGDLGSESQPKTNQECYKDFDESLDTILLGIAKYQNDFLPRINLIGQSRGGLVNMQYAINHSDIISNLISLGTPYSDGKYEDLSINRTKDTKFIYDDWASLYNVLISFRSDALNPSGYDDMLNNSNYKDSFNSCANKFKSYAIGFNQTYQYFINTIGNILTKDENFLDNLAQKMSDYTHNFLSKEDSKNFINELINNINNSDLKENILQLIEASDKINGFLKLFSKVFNMEDLEIQSEITANFLKRLYSIVDYDIFCRNKNDDSIIQSDICVNLDSQLGLTRQKDIYSYLASDIDNSNYQFTKRDIITLGDEDNNYYYQKKYTAQTNYMVGHNFENKNPTAIKKIGDYLKENSDLHHHTFEWNYTNSKHNKVCACGTYNFADENHKLNYSLLDSTSHSVKCSICGYQDNKNHSFKYQQIGTVSAHKKICEGCGYSEYETHLYSLYKLDNDINYHTSMCKCGLIGTKEKHTINKITGSCVKCNYELFKPTKPFKPIQ